MHNLTSVKARPVRFRAWTWEGAEYTIQFDTFQVLDSSTNYKLRLESLNASATSPGIDQQKCRDNFTTNANQEFTTIDRDNDSRNFGNCAERFGGAGYWYKRCTLVSPNVEYCPSSSCGNSEQNMKLRCLTGNSYSMKMFQIDVFVA